MKELTIKQKAKAYDEAFDKVAHFIKKHIGFGCMIHPNSSEAKELFNIFPQLKESEDERIRKELINYFIKGKEYLSFCGFSKEEILAWLEKQGGHDFVEEPNFFNDFRNSDVEVDSNEDGLIAETIRYKKEQKLADKVESKFKVGDWLVHNERRNIIKVVNATPLDYEVVDVLGYHHTITDVAIEENYHLWTIKDAKDGDVLTTDMYPVGTSIFIFKSYKPSIFSIYCYCFVNSDGDFKKDAITYYHRYDVTIYPATKEQRDLLFSKMKEEGYELDAEKKIEIKQGEQKPAWSEEDEEMWLDAIKYLELFDAQGIHGNKAVPCINWLKSLKPQKQKKLREE